MTPALVQALDLVERCEGGDGPAAGEAMLDALRPLGANSLWARAFDLTPNWIDPKINGAYRTRDYVRLRRADWQGSAAQIHADGLCPLARGAARFQRPFFCTDIAPRDDRAYGSYWEAMGEFGVGDTLAVPWFGPRRMAAALTIWFEPRAFAPSEATAVKLAAMLLLDRLRLPDALSEEPAPRLTPRERDCLGFVAEGKSDWEIGVILGVSQTTAHSHIENAKRKLGARTRAQAVARMFALSLL